MGDNNGLEFIMYDYYRRMVDYKKNVKWYQFKKKKDYNKALDRLNKIILGADIFEITESLVLLLNHLNNYHHYKPDGEPIAVIGDFKFIRINAGWCTVDYNIRAKFFIVNEYISADISYNVYLDTRVPSTLKSNWTLVQSMLRSTYSLFAINAAKATGDD